MGMKMELTRKQVIKELEDYYSYVTGGGNINDFTEALDYAIASLKTDEAYQIMYEGGEIFTKADMVAILTEIQLEIEELYPKARKTYRDGLTSYCEGVDDSREIIQQKINALKGEKS